MKKKEKLNYIGLYKAWKFYYDDDDVDKNNYNNHGSLVDYFMKSRKFQGVFIVWRNKKKLSMLQAVEAHTVLRRGGSHIF
jgi:hypothetical protein